ncbi:TetR family transcriptional regulator [Actinoplanes sp. SE50]|uniref:TetR/AcrR family transcriptional regulator n=1 Tax=unclassified Actinoplanes TaxID=2626549 RepID=UPI00023EBCF9|nr:MULTISPECIES: TetR/AcrR family transcriptional regulator C-terminal domain-containing protein [unclassified Actinoplanes]AEV82915.1 Tetracycline repressor protein class H [Actinoplanes sp. SE50/110]ATO81311.1 TetR family transcriptional regulator [Actinoplanes sp. SE50]SLL98718.1 TetR family transcriptional regulator [Actinoplanes sp. SE50/110]
MSPRRVPVSRRDRPAKPPLSRAGAVAVGLRIMREEGLERLTMRRLAAELDTGPASLYVYVQNTAELHGAILDELLADLPVPAAGDGWRGELIELLCGYTRTLFAHPSLARSVLTLRPSGPHYLRLVDAILGLLLAGGVPSTQAAWGVDLLLQLGTATAAEQGTRDETAGADDETALFTMAVREAPAGEFPHLAQTRDHLFTGTGVERLKWAFSALITGIETVATTDPTHPA